MRLACLGGRSAPWSRLGLGQRMIFLMHRSSPFLFLQRLRGTPRPEPSGPWTGGSSSARDEIAEIFDVPLGAANGRVRQAKDCKADFPLRAPESARAPPDARPGSRTTPFLPTFSRPASNCGLTRQTAWPSGFRSPAERGQNELERDEATRPRTRNPARRGSARA